jgi:ATP-dependent protease ClpP protease subunit
MNLFELISRPTLHVTGQVGQEDLDRLSALIQLVIDDAERPNELTLMLSTPGGECRFASAMRELIRGLQPLVDTRIVALGTCFSAGISLLVSVPVEHRYTTPGTRFMIHPASTKLRTNVNFSPKWLENDWQEPLPEVAELRTQELYDNEQILNGTVLSRKQFKRLLKTDSYFGADQALEWGFVGHILVPGAVPRGALDWPAMVAAAKQPETRDQVA